jgi:hypothetical protein
MLFAGSELHDEVTLGNDTRLDPTDWVELTAGGLEELPSSLDALGPSGSERVIDDVRRAESFQSIDVARPVSEFVDLADD